MTKTGPVALVILAAACSQPSLPRQELVDRVQPIGVAFNHELATPEDPAVSAFNLTLYALAPPDQAISVELKTTTPADAAPASSLLVDAEAPDLHPNLQVFSANAHVVLPAQPREWPYFHYSFRVVGGSTERDVEGVVILEGPGAALSGGNGDVVIEYPEKDAVLPPHSRVPIGAYLFSGGASSYRLSWYVSGGEIDDRRESYTTWQTPGPGRHTLVATARPTSGTGLEFVVVDVVVGSD